MLPVLVSAELKDAIGGFLRSAFPITTPWFQRTERNGEPDPLALIDGLLEKPGEVFKGPWLDVRLPFRLAAFEQNPFRHLPPLDYTPYQHQAQAFSRLCGDSPRSTLIATGTGSGKTECFMLPVLDDALARRERGIKAIIVYPMNALAADQARRFAREASRLKTRLTVGLFVGSDGGPVHTTMAPDHVITCQKTLRENPPDILLTNYKMLDFLLIRPKDRPLWRFNRPGMLRYLVVDELHTFDGAQGTDLACLVRRLRDRLGAGSELACVGTSATMGTDSVRALVDYASEVFAALFDEQSILLESRLSATEYLFASQDRLRFFGWPDPQDPRLEPGGHDRAEDYLFQQARLWFGDEALTLANLQAADPRKRAEAAVQLGEWLHQHQAFHSLIHTCASLTDLSSLATDWSDRFGLGTAHQAEMLIASLASLVSAARLWRNPEADSPAGLTQPFLYIRQQFWLRELRRMVCSVPKGSDAPELRFADDLKNPEKPLHLPLLHCRECHLAAWGAVRRESGSNLNVDLQDFYQAWFGKSAKAMLMVPQVPGRPAEGGLLQFCPDCFAVQSGRSDSCTHCGNSDLRQVWVPDMTRSVQRNGVNKVECGHDCPACGARDALTVLGYRAATLASVMTGRLFHTPYNDDYKLIAFSDSVQDAAHRAGFLGANTWRQVVRQAMRLWLREQRVPESLAQMAQLLPGFWRARLADDRHFCGLFLPPNLAWHPDYRRLTQDGRLPAGSQLPDLVSKRLAWECVAEFGRRSLVGRSLERSGQAGVAIDQRRLSEDISHLASILREELIQLREVTDDALLTFVRGLLVYIRRVGAVDHPFLEGYLNSRGKEFLLNRLPWMPGFGRTQRPPAAITLAHVAGNFEALVQGQRETWAVQWLKKCLGEEQLFIAAEARELFATTLKALTRAGWLVEHQLADSVLWMLNPERLNITAQPVVLHCDQCRHPLPVDADSSSHYLGVPCLRRDCHGYYGGKPVRAAKAEVITMPRRLVPAEHTGLLRREDREQIEASFMEGTEPWDVNLLSATPTLEMGIDIGELSSVLLCSVPPSQANYLQRIGRAGRRDGNALAITIANGQNHDLYFYADPLEMMAGEVTTPGVFLKALAVLERQLLAFSMDRWNATGIDEMVLPATLGKVLDAVEHQHTDRFPYNLLTYVEAQRDSLLEGFFSLFPALEPDERDYLRRFVVGDSEHGLEQRLVRRLQELVEERDGLNRRVRQLKTELDQLYKQPEDELVKDQIAEVSRERNAQLSLLAHLRNQPLLNFLTDEGLLPNYAFPEAGVTLRSVILRRRSHDEQTRGEHDAGTLAKDAYQFQRPAQAALSELAPQNTFYAISHQMEIEQIDLQLSRVEDWRFCDRCSYTERVDTHDVHSACPRCGSPQWSDSGQRHTVLKLRQVYATVDDRHNRIGDDTEQREPVFYNREMLVDLPPETHQGGFRLDSESLPFGFEFLSRAVFREINFGQRGGDSHHFSVAGNEMPREGFHICKHCGKVQKPRYRRNEHPHAWTCPLRKHPERAGPDDLLNGLYLYRELQSEAIRVLLPLSEVAYSDEKLHSFIAALNLGLKAYFRGDVHHLEVTDMREPPTAESGERIYLVIYDRIPGGTGYLKELMRTPQNLLSVLELARDHLNACACAEDAERDGCYRCILAYRHSRNMSTISRRGAAELLSEILELRDQLKPVASLGEISTNVLIESKLEQRFVDALAAIPEARLTPCLINGKAGSRLTLPGPQGQLVSWLVEHQVKVGPDSGVPVMTEIDVLLRPARAEDAERIRPIAVYLDGFQYHHDIVADDVVKRTGLLLSGQYQVFSLGWDDLNVKEGKLAGLEIDLMRSDGPQPEMQGIWDKLASEFGWEASAHQRAISGRGGFEWLVTLLREPAAVSVLLRQRALWRGITVLNPGVARDAAVRQRFSYEVQEGAPLWAYQALSPEDDQRVPGGQLHVLGNAIEGLEMMVTLPLEAMRGGLAEDFVEGLHLHLCLDDRDSSSTDEFKAAWRAFWQAANQLQFLPGFSIATRRALEDGALQRCYDRWMAIRATKAVPVADGEAPWAEVMMLTELDVAQVRRLAEAGLPEPEVGVDLADNTGAVVLGGEQVELCWANARIAVVTAKVAAPEGWRFIFAEGDWAEQLLEIYQKGAW